MTTCGSCGATCATDDLFCEQCGHSMTPDAAPTPWMVPTARPTSPAESGTLHCSHCDATDFDDDGFCMGCGMAAPKPDRIHVDLGAVAAVTDRGIRHARNEDAMAIRLTDTFAALVVCDGVSTSENPDIAAQRAVAAAANVLVERLTAGADPSEAMTDAAVAAAKAVAELADTDRLDRAPACTYVSAVITSDTVTVGWIGDSRAYWLTADESRCLTTDDSWAIAMVALGLTDYETAAADPRAHALTSWLGADASEIAPHVVSFPVSDPGVILVCSDGLWNYLDTPEAMAEAALPAALSDPIGAAHALADLALNAGGHDNITVAIAPVPLMRSDRD